MRRWLDPDKARNKACWRRRDNAVCWVRIDHPMPRFPPVFSRRVLAAAAAVQALHACVLPSDQTDNVVVTIEAPATLLIRGRTLVLSAHAWERDASGTLIELAGVAFDWRSLRPDLAVVDERSDGTALVTPVNEGIAGIEVVAAAFESAKPGTLEIRVSNALAIDSVTPSTVHYGEQVTLFGVGLGEITRASLGQADLIPDDASFSGEVQGEGRVSFWVPYPAETNRLVAISRRGSTTVAPETTLVRFPDLYHELRAPPPRLDLDGVPTRPPDTLFHNPALAIVVGEGTDAFQLHRRRALGSLTVTLTSTAPVVTLFEPVLTADPTAPTDFPTEGEVGTWALGFSGQYCGENFLSIGRPVSLTAPVTLVRAFRDLPMRNLILAIYGDPPGRYSVTVMDGYLTADPRIAADRLEENDYCAGADANVADPDRAVVLPFADTLTIDNPYEVDWLRFEIPGDSEAGEDVLVTVRSAPRPFGASDSSDVGLMLTSSSIEIIASSRMPGSREALTTSLGPGAYYLIVVDDAGVATRYSLCLAQGSTCLFLDESAGISP